ncbi:hypothetical protein SCHPADRAFT_95068 [Schizopora paradoxa]|uniref:Nucleoporin Nup54 alpha-helical domain-containing protein n=1 Tax=Schizopora paradoxa TaxID=27342 RepID=A0A0H2SB55_9AGAM|nr:hypothetical protein SCHPADRAFT_95068 [Schizopora paradoxa]
MFGQNAFSNFGNTNANPQQAAQSTSSAPSLFGGFGQQTNQNQNQPAGQAGTSLFGAPAAPSSTTTNSLFGAKPASTGSIFGNAPTNTQPAAGSTGGSLFGGGGGLFGNTQNANANPTGAPQGSTLFGTNNASTSQPAAGTSLFGGLNQQQNNAQTGTNAPSLFGSSNIFGQKPATTTQPSLFGQPQPQPQQLAQQQPSFGQSLNTATTPAFGGFGSASTSNQPLGSSLLGLSSLGASSNLLAPKATTGLLPSQQSQADTAQGQFTNLVQRIEGIEQAWNSNSPNCRFQHFFYNLVDPNTVHQYGRPANATNEAAWQKAVRENPDSSCCVPALAIGFDDLQKRVEAQRAQSTAHQEKLKELKTRITTLSESHSNFNSPRLKRAMALQVQLNQRLVRLVQHLHLLIPSIRSSSIRPEEEALQSILESLEEEIRRPGGVGRLKGKLSEFWAIIGSIEAARERERKKGESSVEWAVVDQEGLKNLTQVLIEQQNGIAHLTKIVQGHQRDLDIILGKAPQERETDAFQNSQSHQALLGASVR